MWVWKVGRAVKKVALRVPSRWQTLCGSADRADSLGPFGLWRAVARFWVKRAQGTPRRDQTLFRDQLIKMDDDLLTFDPRDLVLDIIQLGVIRDTFAQGQADVADFDRVREHRGRFSLPIGFIAPIKNFGLRHAVLSDRQEFPIEKAGNSFLLSH